MVLDFGHGASISGRRISPYRGRDLEQFRTQSQPSMLHSSEVDLKADSLSLQDKLDHAATLREQRHVTNGQDGLFVQGFDDFVESGFLRGAQEKNLATPRLLQGGDSPGDHSFSRYRFTCKRAIKNRAKGILAENTNREGVVLGRRDINRPFDEVAKVIKIGGLHVVISVL